MLEASPNALAERHFRLAELLSSLSRRLTNLHHRKHPLWAAPGCASFS